MAGSEAKWREKEKPPALVLGVGNILRRDDGVGVRVVEAMKSRELPGNVELLDGGMASVDLLGSLIHRDKVIIIDAARYGNEPGTLYRFTVDDVMGQGQSLTSLHQVGVFEMLTMARHLGCAPKEVVILGVESGEVDWGSELSPEVAGVVPEVVELVLAELGVVRGADSSR